MTPLKTPSTIQITAAPSASETVIGSAWPMIVVTGTWW